MLDYPDMSRNMGFVVSDSSRLLPLCNLRVIYIYTSIIKYNLRVYLYLMIRPFELLLRARTYIKIFFFKLKTDTNQYQC